MSIIEMFSGEYERWDHSNLKASLNEISQAALFPIVAPYQILYIFIFSVLHSSSLVLLMARWFGLAFKVFTSPQKPEHPRRITPAITRRPFCLPVALFARQAVATLWEITAVKFADLARTLKVRTAESGSGVTKSKALSCPVSPTAAHPHFRRLWQKASFIKTMNCCSLLMTLSLFGIGAREGFHGLASPALNPLA